MVPGRMRSLLPAGLSTATAATTTAAATVAATAATAAATEAAATATPEAAPGRLGSRFVDREGAAAELRLVELIDRPLGVVVGGHLDEREAARSPRRHVAHHAHRVHGPDL